MTLTTLHRRDRIEPTLRATVPVDLDGLEGEIGRLAKTVPAHDHQDYAPPSVRMEHLRDLAVRTIDSFGELPTTELDELVKTAKQEIASLEERAQKIRDDYVRRTDKVKADITRLTTGCLLAKETMDKLRDQVAVLDEVPQPQPDPDDAAGMADKLRAKTDE